MAVVPEGLDQGSNLHITITYVTLSLAQLHS